MNPSILDYSALLGFSAALHHAHATGLLARLTAAGGQTAEQLAGALGLDLRATTLVLRLLAAGGLVVRDGETFSTGSDVGAHLASLPGGAETDGKLWGHLGRFLTTGEPFQAPTRAVLYSQVAGQLGRRWQRDAERVSAALPKDLGSQVLDVGCGSGVWSLALARQRPNMRVTGLDFEAVLESFIAAAEAAGLQDRVQQIAGDAFLCELAPSSFDLIIIANVLRLEPADRARALIARIAPALRPGGAVLIVDAFAAGNDAAELARTLYALHLALRERSGEVHEESSVRSWLVDAGFDQLERIALEGSFLAVGAVLGRRA